MRNQNFHSGPMLRAAAALAVVLTAAPAYAGSITLETQFVGVDVGYYFSGLVSPTYDGRAFATIGSVLMDNGAGLAPGVNAPAAFEAYCVDILGSVFDPGTSTQTVPVTVPATVAPMSTWSDPGGLPTQAGAGAEAAYLYDTYAPTITQNDQRTALAMAIWKVLYDGGNFSVSTGSGSFYVWDDTTGTIIPLANGYLSNLESHLGSAAAADAAWLQLGTPTDRIQNFMGPSVPVASVPEPSSLSLLGMGLMLVLVWRRRTAIPR